jgi:hypothetical protein
MGSKSELYYAVKKVYLNYIDDDDKSELTLEEAEALLELIEAVADEASSDIFLDGVIDDIVDELIEMFPRFHETFDRADEIMDEMSSSDGEEDDGWSDGVWV